MRQLVPQGSLQILDTLTGRDQIPDLHIHAFSAEEILYGASQSHSYHCTATVRERRGVQQFEASPVEGLLLGYPLHWSLGTVYRMPFAFPVLRRESSVPRRSWDLQ